MDTNRRKHLQGKRIKIFTRSFSLEMYRNASKLFDVAGVPVIRLTDQNADGYFFSILKDTTCDIAVNIDEDAFVTDMDAIWDLADFVIENGYANAGCPDGGVDIPRGANPIVTNPFFNVLNLNVIRALPIHKKEINRFSYEAVKDALKAKFPQDLLSGCYDFNCSDAEPYYPFFFWMAYHFKTLYLSCERHKDGTSTILFNHKGQAICYHSWFARFYNVSPEQTKRINALMNEVYKMRNMTITIFTLKDKCLFLLDLYLRWCIKIPMRIARWPRKWKKWYNRYRRNKQL